MSRAPTAAIIGLGSRGRHTYAKYAEQNPKKITITAIADTDPERVREAAETFGVPASNCFHSADELLAAEKLADILFVCTPDGDHYRAAMLALEKEYHLLLEKPIAPNPEECLDIARFAKERGRHVVVCHVLRYTPFYSKIKGIIDSGRIGEVITMQAIENVGYYHHAHSFVRGNWRNSTEASPMILAKCCHDMDILLWLSGRHINNVQSYGSLSYFRREKAPDGAAPRCLDGCGAKEGCPYDAEKIYITSPHTGVLAGNTGWPNSIVASSPTTERNLRHALEAGPYGRCVFHCDNDVVDHQVVNLEMDGGMTASLTMSAFTGEINRHIKVMGALGEIDADLEAGSVKIHVFGHEPELYDTNASSSGQSGHGGGDFRMMDSLVELLNGAGAALTPIDDSIESHMACFAAEYSRTHGGINVPIRSGFCDGGKSDG